MIKDQQYREAYTHIIELGIRLNCKSNVICTAITYFYRLTVKYPHVLRTNNKFAICRACMCAAGAREEDTNHTSAEDVLNVSHKILYPECPPLNLDDERAAGRMKDFDEIRKILTTRSWHFTSAPKVHKQLAKYLSLLRDWQPKLFDEYKMEELCTMVAQDMYVCPSFIWQSDGETIAAMVVHFIIKIIAPEIKTSEYVKNICPQMSASKMRKLRKFICERVYIM